MTCDATPPAGAPPLGSTWTPRRDVALTTVAVVAAVVGVGLLGLLVGYLIRRHSTPALAGPAAPAAPPVVVALPGSIFGGSYAAAVAPPPAPTGGAPQALPTSDLSSSVNHDTMFSTITVTTQIALAYSTPADRFYKVQIRTVGPPGSFIMLATDSSKLRGATTAGGGILVIPAGQSNEIRLKPRQQLWAVGNVNGVTVSLAAYPEAI